MNFLRKNFRIISLVTLLFVGIITVFSFSSARHLKFDYDFESFFPSGDPELEIYQDFRKTFEYDNEFVLLAFENKKGIFQKDFLEKVQGFADSLRQARNVTSVIAPTDLEYAVVGPLGPVKLPYLHIDEPEQYATDSARIYKSEELVGSFFSTDARSLCLYIKTTEGIAKLPSDTLLGLMNGMIETSGFDGYHMAGKINGQKVYLDRLQNEFVVFFISSFFLIMLFLLISFRSAWGVWVPIVIVLLAILWTMGLMQVTGKALDIMTVLLPTMMFVVGMSDTVHIMSKYLEEMRAGRDRFTALVNTIREAGFPTFLTLITTSLGFLTLLYSTIKPIRDFGIYTSLGVFIAFILSYSLMPVILNSIREPNLRRESKSSQFWEKRLHRLLGWIFRNAKAIMIAVVLFIGISIFGITRIELNNYLIEGLTRGDELRENFTFFETYYSGVRPFEMIVEPRDSTHSLLGPEELRATDRLEQYLQTEYGVGFIFSPATLVKGANKALNGGDPAFYKVPETDSAITEAVDQLAQFKKRKEIKVFLAKNEKRGRLSGKMHDVGSKVIRELNVGLEKFLAGPDMKALKCTMTGGAMLLDKDNVYLVNNMLSGLALSILVVALIIALIHRSLAMTVIAIIPNVVPILLIGGLMGYFGIDLKSSTSIIFSIAFGIATDDTIHFLARLKIEMNKGKSVIYAVKRTFISTGKAVIVTSLILSAGFLTLIFSGFESTFYFGVLVSITLFIAVLTDLLLFPILVVWLLKKKK
ncbi:MAG: hypothetical protein FD123_1432 [Bacteroidetes bacterium]|nr:MAG: hypothetical protein FD123_1432 [Bacteroidota bacterium]